MLADENGNVTDTYDYDAFGNLTNSTGNTANNYRYCGEQFDGTTGLYYLRARYMNPNTGTFISMDSYSGSINDPVSLHKYLYASANPVMYSDPSGYDDLAIQSISMAGFGELSKIMVGAFTVLGMALIAEISYYSATGNSFMIEISDIVCEWVNEISSGLMTSNEISYELGNEIVSEGDIIVSDFLEAKKKSPNLPSAKRIKLDMDEIMSGHSAGGNRGGPRKDRFPVWMTAPVIERAVRLAYACCEKLQTQGDRVFVEGPFDGYKIQMWVNTVTKIIETAWPKY